jgi:uncharacterized membrane protein
MTTEKRVMAFGRHIYGLGVMALGLACLAFGEFDPGQPVPENFPARAVLVYAAGAFMVAAAIAVQWRRAAWWSAAALTVYYALFVVILMNGRLLLTDYATFVTYESIALQLSIATSGLILYASSAGIDAGSATRLIHLGQRVFAMSSLVFGAAHFVYMKHTSELVPKWLPPSQVFWGYLTGVGFVAAGIAILTGIKGRLAATLMTAMIACFGLLVHTPILLSDHSSHWNWTESAMNLAVLGTSWVVMDSLVPLHSMTSRPGQTKAR